jgi:8-oxo-dGTP pyrophosphatase MutT (NUDIX family)
MKRSQSYDLLPAREDGARSQVGALCWRMHRGRVEVLLITSRDTGRWVIPKGWPMEGKSPAQSAFQEAWEEAGVRGKGQDEPIGFFSYDKVLREDSSLPVVVSVFPLRVKELAHRFPERKQRRRRWHDAEKAAKRVAEPELRALLRMLATVPETLVKAASKGAAEAGAGPRAEAASAAIAVAAR